MKSKKIPLIWKVLIACILGCLLGYVMPEAVVRIFTTFNGIFSQYIGFMVPLIIVGLVTASIGKIGSGAGKLLLCTIALAYFSSVVAGLFSYEISTNIFPSMLDGITMNIDNPSNDVAPYFTLRIPPLLDVISALVFAFLFGTLMTSTGSVHFRNLALDFEQLVTNAISKTLIPLLPIYIFGLFLKMSYTGEAAPILAVFAKIIVVILLMSLVWLVAIFSISSIFSRKNPFRCLISMLPAYFTALGTSSSAATIPVTTACTEKCGVADQISKFTVPLCATIHMPGSMIKVTACAITIMLLQGTPFSLGLVLQFVMLLAISAVAAPGVPGGMIMAAVGVLESVLGFDDASQALMITLYIVMDSFGTACNVTSDGAIALIIDRVFKSSKA